MRLRLAQPVGLMLLVHAYIEVTELDRGSGYDTASR
jgi:hypothetical protein